MSKTSTISPESTALINVMFGAQGPLTINLDERDAAISKVVKEAAERNAKNHAARDEKNGVNTPRAIENRKKLALYELKQTAKNAEVRLNCYGVPDVHHWTEEVKRLLKAKHAAGVAGELGEERKCEKLLVEAEASLVLAQERLERFRKENTLAVAALKDFEQSLVPAEAL
jgi:hypothetical protein